MLRLLLSARLLSKSVPVRFSSIKQIPIQNQTTVELDDDDDDDDAASMKKVMSPNDYIFADSKSARFKEKNKRKQKQWTKALEQRHILPQTPLSSFTPEDKARIEAPKEPTLKNEIVRDTYVTPDGLVREEDFQIDIDTDADDEEMEKESDEPVPLAVGGRRQPVWYYAGKLKHLSAENKVEETLDYFYNEMMDKQRVAPNLYCYQAVIGVCARNGYLAQAFDLYREMKDRGFNTVDSRKMSKIFTLLATACYRASDSAMAVDHATRFLDEMKEKGFRIEYRTFNALIAAFGKHQQVKMAFQLADEMTEIGFIPNQDTYASLLIACSSEKSVGFKYAIEIWRRMLAFGIQPTAYHFGLLISITHQCGLGSPESMHALLSPPRLEQVLQQGDEPKESVEQPRRGPSFLSAMMLDDGQASLSISASDQSNQPTITSSEIAEHEDGNSASAISSEWWQNPDDIRKGHSLNEHLRPFSNASILKPNMSYEQPNLVALRVPRSPTERLMLLGGIPGILKHMQESNVLPNSIIFHSFLNLIPSLNEHEEALIHVAAMCQVKLEIRFYNALILRRLRRGAKDDALKVIELMRDQCLTPDSYTFSALAKSCQNRHDAEQLLNEMKDLNLPPNQKVLEAMLNNAFHRVNFPLLAVICESYQTSKLPVNEVFLQRVEKFLLDIRAKILAMEQAKVNTDQYRLLSTSYSRFQKFYNAWLRTVAYAKRFDQKVSFKFEKPNLKK